MTKETEMQEDYKRFSEFWEKARDITDEDGDNFLDWDKSNISLFSFSKGFVLGSQSNKKDVLKILDEMPVVKRLKDGSQVPFKEENAVILTAFKQEFRKRIEGK